MKAVLWLESVIKQYVLSSIRQFTLKPEETLDILRVDQYFCVILSEQYVGVRLRNFCRWPSSAGETMFKRLITKEDIPKLREVTRG